MAAMFALVVLVGCVLPWWTIVVADGLPPTTDNAFGTTGILVFLAAMAVLALVTLRLASERPLEIDRLPAYLIILGAGTARLRALRLLGCSRRARSTSSGPTTRRGCIVVIVGLAGLGRGILEIYQEPDPR